MAKKKSEAEAFYQKKMKERLARAAFLRDNRVIPPRGIVAGVRYTAKKARELGLETPAEQRKRRGLLPTDTRKKKPASAPSRGARVTRKGKRASAGKKSGSGSG